jgi:hypothetical protein
LIYQFTAYLKNVGTPFPIYDAGEPSPALRKDLLGRADITAIKEHEKSMPGERRIIFSRVPFHGFIIIGERVVTIKQVRCFLYDFNAGCLGRTTRCVMTGIRHTDR